MKSLESDSHRGDKNILHWGPVNTAGNICISRRWWRSNSWLTLLEPKQEPGRLPAQGERGEEQQQDHKGSPLLHKEPA